MLNVAPMKMIPVTEELHAQLKKLADKHGMKLKELTARLIAVGLQKKIKTSL